MKDEKIHNLSNLIDQIPGLVFWKDDQNRYFGTNDEYVRLLGFQEKSNVIEQKDYDIYPSKEAEIYHQQDNYIMQGNTGLFIDLGTLPNLKRAIAISHKKPLVDSRNKIIAAITHATFFTHENYSRMLLFMHQITKISEISTIYRAKHDFVYGNLNLTFRQAQVIHHLFHGKTAVETACLLKLSPKTVESYIASVKDKLNCTSRSELIAHAFQLGFIDLLFFEP